MKLLKNLRFAVAATLLSTFGVSAMAQQLAFPEAAGWGRFARGARASASPTVYHVTNLNDSGSGSLRDAVSQPNRIVVFDVSGVIKISSRMVFSKNLYIAGQTAPGEGITVYGNGVSFSGASDIICRYLRVRMGHGGDSGKDCAGISNGTNMIFDHCSFSWGLDETFSINPDGKGDIGDITLMNTIIGQGLLTHSAGGLMQADRITLYRNFYCDNSTRNNKVKGINQYANNVVYNWQNGCYIMGGDSEGSSYVNIESNLFINGPAKGGVAFGGGNADFHFYGDDNWQDSNIDGKFDPVLMTATGGGDRVSKPYDYPTLDLYPGDKLLELNIPTVGASLPYRDQSDYYMVDEVMSYGKSGKIITYETSLPIGAPDTWAWYKGTKKQDTDGDGMPDAWEDANGTDKTKNDATVKAANGYLNIENYINSITADDREYFLRKPITLEATSATTSTITVSWRDYTYAEDGFVVEIEKNGTWTEAGRADADAKSFVIKDLDEATIYNVRVRAFGKNNGADAYSDYATITASTRQKEAGIVDIDSYVPDVTNSATVAPGQKLLLTTNKELSIELTENISPESVVATGKGNITVSGVGIAGNGSVNKGDEGTLSLNGLNSYKGATVLHEGVLEFNSLKNGGEASSLGASIADPQNWIMDGGTYRYTGGSTTTDRGARILRPSTLEIANNGVKITENGSFEGAGDFELAGGGILSVANATNFFKYSGNTILSGGTLLLSDVENASKVFAGMGRKVVMNGGTLQFAYKKDDSQTYKFPIEVVEGTKSTLSLGTTGAISNDITGSGDLEIILPYLRLNFTTTLPNFTGKIIANGVPSSGSQSLCYHSSQFNSPRVRFELKGKTYMAAWTTNAVNVIGGLSGDAGTFLVGSSKQTKGFTCSWEVGGANSDETFRGVINDLPAGLNSAYSGKVSIKKVGTGLWRLTGANTYSGTTTVSAGELIVNGTHSGAGNVTVMNGATLKGEGTISGKVLAYSGSVIEAGDTIPYGKSLTLKGGATFNKGTKVIIPLYRTSSIYRQNNLKMSGTLTIADGVTLELNTVNVKDVEDGGAFTIFGTMPTTISGQFSEIIPAKPAEGFLWDTSTLYTDGKLRIVKDSSDPTAVEKVEVTESIKPSAKKYGDAIYDLQGKQQTKSADSGLYIQKGKVRYKSESAR